MQDYFISQIARYYNNPNLKPDAHLIPAILRQHHQNQVTIRMMQQLQQANRKIRVTHGVNSINST